MHKSVDPPVSLQAAANVFMWHIPTFPAATTFNLEADIRSAALMTLAA